MTNNALIPIEYKGNRIRPFIIDGKPWFALTDVCAVLGVGNPRDVKRRLNQAGVDSIDASSNPEEKRSPGTRKTQTITIINEPNLYRVILRSDKQEAQPFMNWVTEEVLPSLREKGYYGTQSTIQHDYKRRYLENRERTGAGRDPKCFSIIEELFEPLYVRFELLYGFTFPDKNEKTGKYIRPDISVGLGFNKHLRKKHLDKQVHMKTYKYKLNEGFTVDALQYPRDLIGIFSIYLNNEWIPEIMPDYFSARLIGGQRKQFTDIMSKRALAYNNEGVYNV